MKMERLNVVNLKVFSITAGSTPVFKKKVLPTGGWPLR
jgi:hypothetical protein